MLVSVHQAAFNAFARHLEKHLGGDVIVSRKWPPADQALPPKMVSLVYTGARKDIPLDPMILSVTDGSPGKVNTVYQIRACEQPLQLDVWARNEAARDDIVARLDSIMNMESYGLAQTGVLDHGNGTLVKLADGWSNTFADFYFDSPENLDSADSVLRSEYRTSYSGMAWFMLTVTRENAKQQIIRLRLSLNDGSPDITDIT